MPPTADLPFTGADGVAPAIPDGIVPGHRRVKAGQALFRQGDAFIHLYSVRNGSFKSTVTHRNGRDQVGDFSLAGDLLGVDAIADGIHPSTVLAMEDSEVWPLPAIGRPQPGGYSPAWQDVVCRYMGREIARDQVRLLLLGTAGPRVRLAAFLLDLSHRMGERGGSPTEFQLRMSRAEMASYMGVALETVSRTLSAFQQGGLLRVSKRHIRILRLDALRAVLDEAADRS